ncbi:SIR2 family NAD-dependent protein deacylase [Longivirga aurantiaca]|uniref:protein acetyllysine N-acetyltransferase n=1 Tax=Longivirga aurantiaca TaxID=1837743 RepID=A0ABW1T387_9ACTN
MSGTRLYRDDADIAWLREHLRSAQRVLILTGAGVSRGSGLPTYRGKGGIYEDSEIEALHHADGLPGSLPELWSFWGPKRRSILDAQPNDAHRAIAEYQWDARTGTRSVTLATQNIDDLHERGGSPQVAHLHGTLFATHCYARCGYAVPHDITPYGDTPVCPRCGGWLRPSVVLFGEQLDVDAQMAARHAVRECDLLLAVGTSGEVSTAANLIRYASDVGALLVSVDPAPSVPPIFDVQVQLPAEDALPRILL